MRLPLLILLLLPCTGSFAWELEVLETRGSAYERGLQHGRHFRKQIRRDFEVTSGWGWSVGTVNRTPGMLSHFLIKLRALPNGQELIDEMQGIAEGSGVSFNDIAGLNLTHDLGERSACSMAILPNGPDGPILLNTLDDFPAGKLRQNYPCFIQVAYPTSGHTMVLLCNYGTVWAHQGLNDAGLAVGSTSGGIGFPRFGTNYDGVYYALLHRYALQNFDRAADAIALYTGNRQISKGINLAVLDAAGAGAMIEYAATAVGTRPVENGKPLSTTNFFQTNVFPTYEPAIESYDYMKNARARYRRLEQLLARDAIACNLAFAHSVVRDHFDGQQGQICQDNAILFTTSANVWQCKPAAAHCYLGFPGDRAPRTIALDPSKKPAEGKPAPANDSVQAVLDAPPVKIEPRPVHVGRGLVTSVDAEGMTFTFTTTDHPERRADISGAQVQLLLPATLADVPATSRASLWGKASADGTAFEAARVITYRPPHPWPGAGRVIANEAAGAVLQDGPTLSLQHDPAKPPVKLTLADDCEIFISSRGTTTDVKPGQTIELFGTTLFDGDAAHATHLLIHQSSAEAAGNDKVTR